MSLIAELRKQFPLINSHPICYMDNAATTQKPQQVINALNHYYTHLNANVHRGAHQLSDLATTEFEKARARVQNFIGARDASEIIWTRGTTESINLLANSWGKDNLTPGDGILISTMEHHANIVPWQQLAKQTGARLRVVPLQASGDLDLVAFRQLLGENIKLVALTHISNVLGCLNPIAEITRQAHEAGALVFIDGAQALAHEPINVQQLDCDFYAASAHKAYGPTGIGFLYGKQQLLDTMPPWQTGGEMIEKVSFEKTTFNTPPFRFEAGTPAIAEAIGFAAALKFLQEQDQQALEQHEASLLQYLLEGLQSLKPIRIIGAPEQRRSLVSFSCERIHPYDLGAQLNQYNIAIRTGHHCAMPLMDYLGLDEGTARASLALYNNREDINALIDALDAITTPGTTHTFEKSIHEAQSDLLSRIGELTSWQDKLNMLTQIAQTSPTTQLAESEKNEANRLHGCTSQVWLTHQWNAEQQLISFNLDSNSKIIRGLAAVILELVNAQSPATILQLDFKKAFENLGLSQHLSPSRNNGVQAIASEVKAIAGQYAEKPN